MGADAVIGHARVERINEQGIVAIMKCVDCGQEMSMGEAITTECSAEERTSKETALMDAIENV